MSNLLIIYNMIKQDEKISILIDIVALIVTITTITPTIDPMLNFVSAQHNSTTLQHQ